MPIVDRLLAAAPCNLPSRLWALQSPAGSGKVQTATAPHFSCAVSLDVVIESVLTVSCPLSHILNVSGLPAQGQGTVLHVYIEIQYPVCVTVCLCY